MHRHYVFSTTGGRPASYCHGVMCVHPSFHLSVRPFFCTCVCKLFLQKTSLQKLLTGFLPNFTGMFLSWSSFHSFKLLCSMKNSGCLGNQSKKSLKIFSSQTTNWIALFYFQECSLDRGLQKFLD